MELRRDSPLRRKRIIPSGVVLPLGTTAGNVAGETKRLRPDGRPMPAEGASDGSPFDAVLAAATISGKGGSSGRPALATPALVIGRNAPVRIAPNAAVPLTKPTLPVRKRVTRAPAQPASASAAVSGAVSGAMSGASVTLNGDAGGDAIHGHHHGHYHGHHHGHHREHDREHEHEHEHGDEHEHEHDEHGNDMSCSASASMSGSVSVSPLSLPLPPNPSLLPHSSSSTNAKCASAALSNSTIKCKTGTSGSNPSTNASANFNCNPSHGASKIDKGLRHFSMRVSAKVEEKGATTYNEVADELVQEIGREVGKCDHKNIRRRVYDALNVLMAIDVIRKDKKEIRWLGLPNEAAAEMRQLDETIGETVKRIREKRKTLGELVHRLAALKALINRNQEASPSSALIAVPATATCSDLTLRFAAGAGSANQGNSNNSNNSNSNNNNGNNNNSGSHNPTGSSSSDKLPLPFILINAPRDCRVHCEMLEDRSQYFFEFDSPFLINEDIELLRLMGLDQISEADLHSWLPMDAIAFLRDTSALVSASVAVSASHCPYSGLASSAFGALADGGGAIPDLPLDIGGVLGLDEWAAAAEGGEAFLESMPPPALGGMATMGFSMADFAPAALSSPVRGSSRRTADSGGGAASMANRLGDGSATSAANAMSRPLRPFRQATSAQFRNRSGSFSK